MASVAAKRINAEMMTPFKNEPLTNFSLADERKKMMDALQRVKSQLGKTYGLHFADVVDGSSIQKKIVSLNPCDPKEIVGYCVLGSPDDAEKALQTVYEGSKTWTKTPAYERIGLLEKLGDWMIERKYDLAAWMVYEVGKTWREADADVAEAIDFCKYYAREMHRLSQPRLTQIVQGEKDLLMYYPKGVAVIIAPWNFPLAILTGMTVAALVAGNTVIIKPAEPSCVIGAYLARGLKEVGFPENSFYFLPCKGSETGPKLVGDARVDLIGFTGSADVGLWIIEEAAKKPKPGQRGVKKVIAEMGGKNAVIVDEDADLDEAITGCIHSAFGFQGQKCSALSRLLVHENVYDSFVKRFVDAAKALKIGNATQPEFQMGPVVDEASQKRILKTIADGKTRMKVLFEGSVPSHGFYVPPTIFETNTTSEPLFQNEIFGPVVVIKKIHSLDEGLKDANSVQFALTGGIFSRSPSHIQRAVEEFEVGNLYINRAITGAIVERHPFGGFKFSGCGSKAGGPDYLLQFLEPRTVAENTVRRGFAGES